MSEMLKDGRSLGAPPSPGSFHSRNRKRKRKALACYHCRRRKVKCGREIPSCGRCREAGQGGLCTYETENPRSREEDQADEALVQDEDEDTFDLGRSMVLPAPGAPEQRDAEGKVLRVGPSVVSQELVVQAQKIRQLESRVASLEARQPGALWQTRGTVATIGKDADQGVASKAISFLTSPRDVEAAETILFRGANFMTQYYGGTNPTSLIAHFPELRTFMKEAIMHHTSLPRAQRDLKALQMRWKSEKINSARYDGINLLDLLPGREIADHLSKLYFGTFETSYRILHAPTFWKEYESLWREPQNAKPAFLAILLLAMSTVSCISSIEQSTYIGDSSTSRETAVFWIEACDSWHRHQSQKHAYLAIWQVRCLLLLAKQTNTVKKKKIWTFAGSLMREFMSAGFHRDPKLLGSKVSTFEQEMRRRLWSTMVELDLQASIDRGMASTSAAMPSDSASPLNVDDDEFDEDSLKPPMERPLNEYTATSFLRISRKSLSLRIALNCLLNEIGSHPPYDDVMEYDEQIMQKLQEIPIWTEDGRISPSTTLAQTLLDVQLRQFLILLHGPFARQAQSNSRYTLSKISCFNAASSILDQHSRLINSGNNALHIFRNDVFRSALAICHNVYVSHNIHNDSVLHKFDSSFIQHVEKSLEMLADKITSLGTGYTHYWYISAAYGLIQSTTSPDGLSEKKQQAIDRVARQYYKVLASQQDMSVAKERIHFKSGVDRYPIDDAVSSLGLPTQEAGISQDCNEQFEEYYFGDPSAWTFDNLWSFDQIPLPEYQLGSL